jgi:phospholipase C
MATTSKKLLPGCVSLLAMGVQIMAPSSLTAQLLGQHDENITTPIKHVIVIYGENRSFDHLFATVAAAGAVDYGLLPRDLRLLTTGASGLPEGRD